jgi:hypothetical protein
MLEFILIVIAFALVLWLVLRHNRKQTEQHDNSFVHQSNYSTTGLNNTPGFTHTSQVSYTGRVRTVSHTGLLQPVIEDDDDTVDAALVLAQAVYMNAAADNAVQADDDQPTFVPGGGDSGGGGASDTWVEPESSMIAADPEPDNSPNDD